MNEEKWLTVSDLAEQLEIPQPTIRRYIERHGHHLHIKKQHKSYLISSQSISVFIRIREGYSEGMNSDQVEMLLASIGAPTIINVSDTIDQDSERVSVGIAKVLSTLEKSVIDEFKKQEEFNRMLLKALEHERIDNQRRREEYEHLTALILQQKEAAATIALPNSEKQRNERLNERLTERKIERQLEAEALSLWESKPEAERIKKVGWIRKEENIEARDRFVRDYVDKHYEQLFKEEYGL